MTLYKRLMKINLETQVPYKLRYFRQPGINIIEAVDEIVILTKGEEILTLTTGLMGAGAMP